MKAKSDYAELQRISLAVAEVWIGSATYRESPEKFISFRDSLLKAKGLSEAEIQAYIKSHEAKTEESYLFSQTVSRKVDSLYRIIDSTLKARPRPVDTTKVAAQKPPKATPQIQKRMGSVPIYPEQK